ncbi:MAG: hypothetical protein KAJ44_00480 [Thermoplasmatales archaeon]|nr:hypothetical protein [Thermoplasmatales archaeon]
MARNVFTAMVKDITTITVEKRVHELLTCIARKDETYSQVVDFLINLYYRVYARHHEILEEVKR